MRIALSTKSILASIGAALALASFARPAAAIVVDPSTEYPAQMCQSDSSGVSVYLASINNTSTTTQTIQCPIPNTWSGRIGMAQVSVVDRNPSADISCTIYVLDDTHVGGFGWWQTQSSTGAAEAVQKLDFTAIGPAATNHYFNMQCSLPGTTNGMHSFLKSYWIYES